MSVGQTLEQPGDLPKSPPLECDIVMAGGITSGIIYPGAVATIAKRYAFRSIGGTSVGAIAACVTAAAEFGRRTSKNGQGFDRLAGLHTELAESQRGGQTRLFHLFSPQAGTKPLLAMALPFFTGRSKWGKIFGFIVATLSSWQVFVAVTAALITGCLPGLALWRQNPPISLLAFFGALAFALLIWLVALASLFYARWYPSMRKNFYGICVGNPSPSADGAGQTPAPFEHLTPWMHRQIQAAAGLALGAAPLTFGNLWTSSPDATPEDLRDRPRDVELVMITSDISRNRMAQLPFLETPSPLYIERCVLDAFFPKTITDWMVAHAGTYDPKVQSRSDVTRLPYPQNIPVLFGARMSLSFPILLSALPLMTPDFAGQRTADGKVPLKRVWYSDGGLTSNFPIHFFDSPVPSRPTFCLNLVSFDTEVASPIMDDDGEEANADPMEVFAVTAAEDELRTARNRETGVPAKGAPPAGDKVWSLVTMNKGNRMSPAPFSSFDAGRGSGAIGFLNALLNTARGWSDNQLLLAAGVRERVVNIALRDDEGGLNLEMTPNAIKELDYRGRAAGQLISAHFDPDCNLDPATGGPNVQVFPNHRWVRYRNFMGAIEDILRRFALARPNSDAAAIARGEMTLGEMVIAGQTTPPLGYHPLPAAAQPCFEDTANTLEQLAHRTARETTADPLAALDSVAKTKGAAPRPKMRFQLKPLVNNDPRAEHGDLPH